MKRYKLNSMLSPETPIIIGSYDDCVKKQAEFGLSGALLTRITISRVCECKKCQGHIVHESDCSVHNEPYLPKGKCDCKPLNN